MPEIAVVGGTGIYNPDTFELIKEVRPNTPYGKPSSKIMIGKIAGVEIAFLFRHGERFYGFAGLRSDGEVLSFAPRLPERWKRLCFSVMYQSRVLRITMERNSTLFQLTQGEPLDVRIYGEAHVLTRQETRIQCL